MKKTTKIALIIGVLLLLSGSAYAVWFFLYKGKITDKNGNVFELKKESHPASKQDYSVYVNGKLSAGLKEISLDTDGFVRGSNAIGMHIKYTNSWNQIQ